VGRPFLHRTIRRATIIASLSALLLSLLAGLANAEGSWSSYLSGVYPPFQSRTWYDGHVDAASTSVYFGGCDDGGYAGTNVSAAVRLYREVPFWPAEDRGMTRLYCYIGSTGYYGEQPTAGNFHWTVEDVDGGYHILNASSVQTNY
jgi:hypothetical protein